MKKLFDMPQLLVSELSLGSANSASGNVAIVPSEWGGVDPED